MVEIIKEWARRIWASWPFWVGALTVLVTLDVILGDWGWLTVHAAALALCAARWQLQVAAGKRSLCVKCQTEFERWQG